MSALAPAPVPPDCPGCGHARRVRVIVFTSHDRETGEWWERDVYACGGCWIVVQEIPGSKRQRKTIR